jgi:hypothetical protein
LILWGLKIPPQNSYLLSDYTSDRDVWGDNIKLNLQVYGMYWFYFSNFSVYRIKEPAAEDKIKNLPVPENLWNFWNIRKNAIVYRRICSMEVAS